MFNGKLKVLVKNKLYAIEFNDLEIAEEELLFDKTRHESETLCQNCGRDRLLDTGNTPCSFIAFCEWCETPQEFYVVGK